MGIFLLSSLWELTKDQYMLEEVKMSDILKELKDMVNGLEIDSCENDYRISYPNGDVLESVCFSINYDRTNINNTYLSIDTD